MVLESRITAFQALFQYTGLCDGDIDEQLSHEILHDKENKITQAILFIYSLETFLPYTITFANCEKDETKVDTLGPISLALRTIVHGA